MLYRQFALKSLGVGFEEAIQEGIIQAELEKETRDALKVLIAEVASGHLEYRLNEVISKAKLTDSGPCIGKSF